MFMVILVDVYRHFKNDYLNMISKNRLKERTTWKALMVKETQEKVIHYS